MAGRRPHGRRPKALTDPFDPLTYAHGLAGKRLLMIAGKIDEVVPPDFDPGALDRRRPSTDRMVRLRPLLGRRLHPAGDSQDR